MRIVYSFKGKEEVFECEKAEIVIGRPNRGITIDLDPTPDTKVSRPHARIWVDEEGQYWIEDLDSKHGTFIDGKNIKGMGKVKLKPNVKVKMGKTMLWLEGGDTEMPPDLP